jgi:hypothetical protein
VCLLYYYPNLSLYPKKKLGGGGGGGGGWVKIRDIIEIINSNEIMNYLFI